MKKQSITRRRFIQAAGTTALAAGGWLACSPESIIEAEDVTVSAVTPDSNDHSHPQPQGPRDSASLPGRGLGRTGMVVSMLGFGGGSLFMKNGDGDWQAILQRALDLGVNYFDTSHDYQGSEERFAQILGPVRQQVYITTKFNGFAAGRRNPDVMLSEVETSLKRLNTDYLDILMLHAADDNDQLMDVEAVFAAMQRLKEQGVIRHTGFSSMNSALKAKELIQSLDFDVCMLAINPTTYGDYETIAVPAAISKQMGVLAMKIMRDVVGKNNATPQELIAWGLDRNGVSAAVISHSSMAVLEENASIIQKYQPSIVRYPRWGALQQRLAPFAGPHALSWARPGYKDEYLLS